jgi:8-oxo-dGTP diphosphatase
MRKLLVTAAIIERGGCYLVARRQAGTHLAGAWEFPGGKCEIGESLHACLVREIEEELGTTVSVGAEVLAVTHEYDDRVVELHFFRCTCEREPTARLGQDLRWVTPSTLATLEFPPADAALIRLLVNGQRDDLGSLV